MSLAFLRAGAAKPVHAYLPYLGLAVVATAVFYLYGLDLPFRRDNTIYLYSGVQLLEGVPPYISIQDQKAPLTSFVVALTIALFKPLTGDPVTAMRVGFILISIGCLLLAYNLARRFFRDDPLSVLAPLGLLAFHGFVLQGAIGGEPKLVLMPLLLGVLICLFVRRWFLMGFLASLGVFAWQPGAVGALVVFGYACVQPAAERLGAVARVVLGAVIPIVVVSAYFVATGAFWDFLKAAILLPLYQSTPDQNEALLFFKSIWLGFPVASPIIVLGLIALGIWLFRELRVLPPGGWRVSPYVPLAAILLGFLAWSFIDYQAYTDFFVLLPFAALGVVALGMAVRSWLIARGVASEGAVRGAMIAALAVVPLLNVAFTNALSRQTSIWWGGLERQKAAYRKVIEPALGACSDGDCRIVVLGLPEIPALLGFRNLSRFVVVSTHGDDKFISEEFGGSFADWIKALEDENPLLVVVKMTELANYSEENRKLLLAWLGSERFRPLSENKDIETPQFRSDGIHTWIAADTGVLSKN